MKADWDSRTMHGPSVAGVIRFMAEIEPVRVTCSCGSRIWVSENSTRWLTDSFIDQHQEHGTIVAETSPDEKDGNLWVILPKIA